MHVYDELKKLLPVFGREIRMARQLMSPNPEDDLTVKTAIVGFSHHSPTEEWGPNHFAFLRQRLDAEYRPGDLSLYGPSGNNIRLFFALCCGYLLGLYQAEAINDQEFTLAEAQIPGLIALHAGQLLKTDV